MADTVLRQLSTAEKHLLSSTRIWSIISTAAVTGALASFYSIQQYSNFNNSGLYIFYVIITIHLIIFISNPKTLKDTFAPFFLGSGKKWMIRITAMRFGYLLHNIPDRCMIGLIFVICVWIDAIAIGRIVRVSVDLWIVNSVFMAVVNRSCDLYGFSGGYWLVMLLCFPLILLQVRMEGYESDEIGDKEG